MIAAIDPTVVLLSLAGAAIGALGAFWAAARQFSGKIETSSASDLWEESRSIREELRERVKDLHLEVGKLEGRVAQLEGRNATLVDTIQQQREEIAELKVKLHAAETQATVSEDQVKDLTLRLADCRAHVDQIEREASGNPRRTKD